MPPTPMSLIIDTHCHTSNRLMVGLHTVDATVKTIQAESEKLGILKTFLIATYFPYKGSGVSNTELLKRINGRDHFKMIGSLDAMNHLDEGIVELDVLAKSKSIVGIKLYIGYQDFRLDEPRIRPLFVLARKYHLPIIIHGGELHHCCPKKVRGTKDQPCKNSYCLIDSNQNRTRPATFAKVIDQNPDITFVIAHLANPFFNELVWLMGIFPNVYTDISGQFVSGTNEDSVSYRETLKIEIQRILSLSKGSERLMFASDFPIQSFKDSIELVKMLDLKEMAKQEVMWRNASRVFDLGL